MVDIGRVTGCFETRARRLTSVVIRARFSPASIYFMLSQDESIASLQDTFILEELLYRFDILG
jgi:hypothetical protein